MKLLMFQARDFAFSPNSLDALESAGEDGVVVVFIHTEPDDPGRTDLPRKAAKNIKWLANKRSLNRVCLHSFAHLAEDKAPADDAERLIDALAERLRSNGYTVSTTPFGQSCAWTLSVFQEPLAKVFKSL